jgi:protein ImuB
VLWIALHLPELALQVSHRGLLPDLPLAISDGATQRPLVIAANQPARQCGIMPGMAVAAAQALHAELIVQARDADKERAALHTVANWVLQFTPTVSLQQNNGVLLEVAASLRLFGGLAMLGKRLESGLHKLGFDISMSVAPTPLAAWLLARARVLNTSVRGCLQMADLPARLDPLPPALLDWPPAIMETLARLGVSTLGQCRRLPRDGLLRRFGTLLLDDLDCAYGLRADLRDTFTAPQHFFSRIELAAELDNLEWLKLPLEQLLCELEGFLRARLQGAQELIVRFQQGRAQHTEIRVTLLTPQCCADDFMLLMHEHLARLVLSAPVQAISLQVDRLLPYQPENHTLVADHAVQALAWLQLHERLAARLPPGALYQVALHDDHRPEHAWRKDRVADTNSDNDAPAVARPAWLLESPQHLPERLGHPHYHGRLTLLTEPERIEAGWWDQHNVSRDYYIARNPLGQLCWIYLDHMQTRWYLHGLFG